MAATMFFLMICPQMPDSLNLRSAWKAASHVAFKIAAFAEKAPVLFVPAWLWLLRQLLRSNAVALFVVALLFGAGVLGAMNALIQQEADRAAKAGMRVLHTRNVPAGSSEPALVPGPVPTQPMCGSLKGAASPIPTAMAKASGALRSGTITPTAAAPAGMPGAPVVPAPSSMPYTPTAAQLQRLVSEVQALQRQVYGKQLDAPNWTPDAVSSAIAQMCKELGLEYRPEACGTYDRMLGKMKELRSTLGIS